MRETKIKKGSEITTPEGYEIVTDCNGHIVFTDSYEIDEDGNENKTCERYLTLEEIGHIMKSVDGKNHKVIWDSYGEDE